MSAHPVFAGGDLPPASKERSQVVAPSRFSLQESKQAECHGHRDVLLP